MGRRRTRRTPSWVTPRGALFQPHDNPPQPASSNVDPAGHRHPHETALKGLATIARGWHLRCLPRVPPPQKLPPLPRDPLRRTQQASSRGRGRGWGSNKLPSRETPPTFPPTKNAIRASARRTFGVSQMVEASPAHPRVERDSGLQSRRSRINEIRGKSGIRKRMALGTRSPAS
jgi:hypothetical protein